MTDYSIKYHFDASRSDYCVVSKCQEVITQWHCIIPQKNGNFLFVVIDKSPEYDTCLKTFISYCSTITSLRLHQQTTRQTEEWPDEKILTVRQLAMLAISPGGFPRSIICLPTIRLYASDRKAVGPKISWRWRTLWTTGATGFASCDALASSSSTAEWTCFAVTRVKPSSVSASIKQYSVWSNKIYHISVLLDV